MGSVWVGYGFGKPEVLVETRGFPTKIMGLVWVRYGLGMGSAWVPSRPFFFPKTMIQTETITLNCFEFCFRIVEFEGMFQKFISFNHPFEPHAFERAQHHATEAVFATACYVVNNCKHQ